MKKNKIILILLLCYILICGGCSSSASHDTTSTNEESKEEVVTVENSMILEGELGGWNIVGPVHLKDFTPYSTAKAEALGLMKDGEVTDDFWPIYNTYKAVLYDYLYNDIGLNEHAKQLDQKGFMPFGSERYFVVESLIHIERLTQEEIDAFKAYVSEQSITSKKQTSAYMSENEPQVFAIYHQIQGSIPKKLKEIVAKTCPEVVRGVPLDFPIPEDSKYNKPGNTIGYGPTPWETNAGIYDLAIKCNISIFYPEDWEEVFEGRSPYVYFMEDISPKIKEDLEEKLGMSVSIFV